MPAEGAVLRRPSASSEDPHPGPHTGDQSSCIISLTFTSREDGKATLFQIHIFALSTTRLGKKHLYFSRKNHRENYPEETRQMEALCLVTEASFIDQEEAGLGMSHSF
ncbi:uncharacterized protein ACBT57_024541 isoform 1-T2 [Dama dama]